MSTAPANPRALRGSVLAASAFALYSSADTLLKLVSAGHSVAQVLTINGIFALLTILAATLATGGLTQLATRRWPQLLVRGVFGTISGFSGVYAFSRIPLVDFYAILFSGPLIVAALAVLLLKERIDLPRWAAIIAGFCGVLVVVDPAALGTAAGNTVMLGRGAALLCVTGYALSMLIVRRMRATVSNVTFSFYSAAIMTSVAAGLWAAQGATALTNQELLELAFSGLLGGAASLLLTTAYMRAPVALVAPFQYTQLLWGAFFGYVVFNNVPEVRMLTGAVIVALSNMFIVFYEMRLNRKAAP